MPDEPTPQPAPAPSPAPQPDPQPDPKAVERQVASAVKQARAEAKAELDAYLAEEARKADLDKLDAASKAEAERDAALAKVQDAEQRLAQREHAINVTARLLEADVPAKAAGDVAKLVDVPVGSDEAAIDAAIGAVRERLPQLFGEAAPVAPTTIRPSSPPPARTTGGQIDPARERARQRHGFTPTNAA